MRLPQKVTMLSREALENSVFVIENQGASRVVLGQDILKILSAGGQSLPTEDEIGLCIETIAGGAKQIVCEKRIAKPGVIKRIYYRLKGLGYKKLLLVSVAGILVVWSLTADFTPPPKRVAAPSVSSAQPALTFGDPLLAQLAEEDVPSGIVMGTKPGKPANAPNVPKEEVDVRNYQFRPQIKVPDIQAPQLSCD